MGLKIVRHIIKLEGLASLCTGLFSYVRYLKSNDFSAFTLKHSLGQIRELFIALLEFKI